VADIDEELGDTAPAQVRRLDLTELPSDGNRRSIASGITSGGGS
jgi:hypothetical protein